MSSRPFSQQSRASTSSADPAVLQRRIKLTIKPLKLKSATSSGSSVDSPGHDTAASTPAPSHVRNAITIKPLKLKPARPSSFSEPPPATAQDEEKKPRPKIKIKPPRPSPVIVVDTNAMDVDEAPVRVVSVPPVDVPPVEVLPPSPPPPPALPPPPPKVKVPRPIKLKPLKEVLERLISQIKRKDDYAFFLNPVDPSQVPGYSDVVKHPMDFGTMTEKVGKGRYRSLEQFKDDFCLVTSNAKAFNPPPSLYHTEASKIEVWGLDQIARAAAQVIEYETDWTIDVVADEGPEPMAGDVADGSVANPVAATGEISSKARSPSVMSSAAGTSNLPVERARRSFRGKKVPIVTESWEEGGHLPGVKDGIGVFPPCSDFAALMVELKLRGKRFRTKKERLKREKEGPPSAADGSLDYNEMENPFSVFQQLVPKPLKVPHLIPLISTHPAPTEVVQTNPETPQPPEEKQDVQMDGPVALPPRALSAILADPNRHTFVNPPNSTTLVGKKRLRHWTITRNPPRSTRARDEEEDGALNGPQEKRRRVEHADYGAFATLMGTLAVENGLRADDFEEVFSSDEGILQQIRQSIESRESLAKLTVPEIPEKPEAEERERLLDAEEYIRDVVYGGVDGLAYFRSLAEFVGEYDGPLKQEPDDWEISSELGIPLAQWVASRVVDPLTLGNHAILRAAGQTLARSNGYGYGQPDTSAHASHAIARYLSLANEDKSAIIEKMRELEALADPSAQIDIAPLLRKPEELFSAENEWAGREREQIPAVPSSASITSLEPIRMATIAGAGAILGFASTFAGQGSALVSDTPGAIEHALNTGAEALRELERRTLEKGQETEDGGGEVEDALTRRTRLTLIALAKRAPIDRIARLPPELVPVHIRHIVPTLGS